MFLVVVECFINDTCSSYWRSSRWNYNDRRENLNLFSWIASFSKSTRFHVTNDTLTPTPWCVEVCSSVRGSYFAKWMLRAWSLRQSFFPAHFSAQLASAMRYKRSIHISQRFALLAVAGGTVPGNHQSRRQSECLILITREGTQSPLDVDQRFTTAFVLQIPTHEENHIHRYKSMSEPCSFACVRSRPLENCLIRMVYHTHFCCFKPYLVNSSDAIHLRDHTLPDRLWKYNKSSWPDFKVCSLLLQQRVVLLNNTQHLLKSHKYVHILGMLILVSLLSDFRTMMQT